MNLFTPKQKLYSCKDSIIYYQKAPDKIIFLIDEEATSKIVKWKKKTIYSDAEDKYLLGASDGSPSYAPMIFHAGKDEVKLVLAGLKHKIR